MQKIILNELSIAWKSIKQLNNSFNSYQWLVNKLTVEFNDFQLRRGEGELAQSGYVMGWLVNAYDSPIRSKFYMMKYCIKKHYKIKLIFNHRLLQRWGEGVKMGPRVGNQTANCKIILFKWFKHLLLSTIR